LKIITKELSTIYKIEGITLDIPNDLEVTIKNQIVKISHPSQPDNQDDQDKYITLPPRPSRYKEPPPKPSKLGPQSVKDFKSKTPVVLKPATQYPGLPSTTDLVPPTMGKSPPQAPFLVCKSMRDEDSPRKPDKIRGGEPLKPLEDMNEEEYLTYQYNRRVRRKSLEGFMKQFYSIKKLAKGRTPDHLKAYVRDEYNFLVNNDLMVLIFPDFGKDTPEEIPENENLGEELDLIDDFLKENYPQKAP
jgi:hypothetical protein